MILLPLDLRERLLSNGRRRGLDHLPIVKLFHPIGAGTWRLPLVASALVLFIRGRDQDIVLVNWFRV